jgi:hypothetical protein
VASMTFDIAHTHREREKEIFLNVVFFLCSLNFVCTMIAWMMVFAFNAYIILDC